MKHDRIIDELFGGTTALASLIARNPSSVSRWKANGIPPNLWKTLIQLAGRNGIELSYERLADGYPHGHHYRTRTGRQAARRNGTP